jgi:Xaa-Pro dipeptidase
MNQDRVADLRSQMSDAGIDCLALWPSANWRYLCDFAPIAAERLCLLLVTAEHVAVVLPNFDVAEMTASAPDALVSGWSDLDGPERTLASVWAQIGGAGICSLAVDDGMPYLFTRLLFAMTESSAAEPPSQRLLSMSLPRYRLVKGQEEIEAIRTTATLIERAITAAETSLRAGMSERDLERVLRAKLLDVGAETLDATLVQFGANSAIPHHLAGELTLARESNVLLDIAVTHGQYFADITRNLALGTPTGKYAEVFDVVRAAQAAGVAAAVPGATIHDVDHACRDTITAAGFGEAFFTRTGHGLGLEVHEPPSVVAGNPLVLEPGMVITVEPGIYLAGEFGVRIEDTIAVTMSAADRLSASSRDLIVTG